MHAAGTVALRDAVLPWWPRSLDDRAQRRLIRVFIVLVTAAAYYFAVVSHLSLVSLLLGSYGGVAQIFPTLIAAFYWKRATAAGATAGLFGGIAVNCLLLLNPGWRPLPMHEGIYGLAVNVVLLVVVSLLTQPTDPKRVNEFSEPGWD